MANWKSDLQMRQKNGFPDNNNLGSNDYNCYDLHHPWSIGTCSQNLPTMVGDSQKCLHPTQLSSSNILSSFASLASPVHVYEPCIASHQHYDIANGNPQILSFQCSEDNTFRISFPDPSGSKSDNRDTFQSTVDSNICSHQHFGYSEPFSLDAPRKFLQDQYLSHGGLFSAPHKPIEDHKVSYSLCSASHSSVSFEKEQQYSESPGVCDFMEGVQSSRARIKWTKELHKKFVDCINCLGGTEKATPRAILNLMDSEGLTIYHIKSHLQKYRAGKYMPDPAQEESDKRISTCDMPQLYFKTSLQIKEAVQMQLECEKHLREQLEIQHKMQLMIEEQMEQLRKMIKLKTDSNLHYSKTTQDELLAASTDIQVLTCNGSENTTDFPFKIC